MSHIICEKNECTGCSVCASSCPKMAIKIVLDEYGFYRPSIDDALCIACNSCSRVCPVNNIPETYGPTKSFAFQNTDKVRFNSTSGGFFNAVACKVLDDGGVVCGAAFDENMILRHIIIENKEELAPLQKSKYVQSSAEGIYEKIQEYLNNDRKVLFVGVGCQAAALRNFIKDDTNLLIIDLVCHGVPSSGLFKDWIAYLEKRYCKVANVNFRDKSYGYLTPNARVYFVNGKYIESCRDSDVFRNFFFRHLSIRESCYNCKFKTLDRASDITIGDLWNIGKYDSTKNDNKGTTCVFSHTDKGNLICRQLYSEEIKTESVIAEDAKNMINSVSPSPDKDRFWNMYKEEGFEALLFHFENNTLTRRIKSAIKILMNKTGLSRRVYKRRFNNKAGEYEN